MAVCYLLHFEPRYKHAGHYIGYSEHLKKRVEHHRNGTGANLTKYASRAGSELIVARVWKKASRETERALKKSKHHSRLCPICNPGAMQRGKIKKDKR